MNKCPRCKKEVNKNDKFCPHCGYDLKQRGVRFKWINVILLLSFFVIPALYVFVLGDIDYLYNNQSNDVVVLKDVQETNTLAVAYHFNDLESFNKKIKQGQSFSDEIHLYENELKEKMGMDFTSSYIIQVYNNYEIAFELNYTFKINNKTNILVNKIYTRSKSIDQEEYILEQKGLKDIKDIEFDEIIQKLITDKNVLNIKDDLLKREDEFNKKKKYIGHFGFGEYQDKVSLVVYKDGKQFKSVLKYKTR